MRAANDVEFSENGFIVKTLHGEQLSQSYRLRHKVFAESLKWVPETDDRQEIDLYDLWGTTVGLIRDDGVVVGAGNSCLKKSLAPCSQPATNSEKRQILPRSPGLRLILKSVTEDSHPR